MANLAGVAEIISASGAILLGAGGMFLKFLNKDDEDIDKLLKQELIADLLDRKRRRDGEEEDEGDTKKKSGPHSYIRFAWATFRVNCMYWYVRRGAPV